MVLHQDMTMIYIQTQTISQRVRNLWSFRAKKNKWLEIEKNLEQQQFSSPGTTNTSEGKVSIEQQIQQLYQLFDIQKKQIEELLEIMIQLENFFFDCSFPKWECLIF